MHKRQLFSAHRRVFRNLKVPENALFPGASREGGFHNFLELFSAHKTRRKTFPGVGGGVFFTDSKKLNGFAQVSQFATSECYNIFLVLQIGGDIAGEPILEGQLDFWGGDN